MLDAWLTQVGFAFIADESEGIRGEEQSVRRGSDWLRSQHLAAGDQQEHAGLDAGGEMTAPPQICVHILKADTLCGEITTAPTPIMLMMWEGY